MPNTARTLAEHQLAGTYRKDRHGARADNHIAAGPLPEPPNWMQPEAVEEYRRVQQAFGDTGLLTCLDAGLLIAYCQLWARLVELEKAVPYEMPHAAYFTTFATIAGRLGLDPQSRARLRVPDRKAEPEADAWAEFANAPAKN